MVSQPLPQVGRQDWHTRGLLIRCQDCPAPPVPHLHPACTLKGRKGEGVRSGAALPDPAWALPPVPAPPWPACTLPPWPSPPGQAGTGGRQGRQVQAGCGRAGGSGSRSTARVPPFGEIRRFPLPWIGNQRAENAAIINPASGGVGLITIRAWMVRPCSTCRAFLRPAASASPGCRHRPANPPGNGRFYHPAP